MKSKTCNMYKFILLLVIGAGLIQPAVGQEDSVVAKPIIRMRYFNQDNAMQYVLVESMLKEGKVLRPQKNKIYELFLDSVSADRSINKVVTDANGTAKTFIPPHLKSLWDLNAQHLFILKEGDEEIINDYIVNKARISIDTASEEGVKTINITIAKLESDQWFPAPEVEMKVGIQRLGGILSAGEEETYTSDSSGNVSVELKKEKMPGDSLGNYLLAVKVEDNDLFGNLLVTKKVPWGEVTKFDDDFFSKRTLWTTRTRTPYWLLALAYMIVLSVWGILIYLVLQLGKIVRLGKQVQNNT